MEPEALITLWTSQAERVLQVLRRGEVYQVKRAYVTAKYREVSWSFQLAYAFFIREMKLRLPPETGEESPIWLHGSRLGTGVFEQAPLLELRLPVKACLFMDGCKWNRILNLEYLGRDQEDTAAFQKKLDRQGLTHASLVFRTPYYPQLKQEILRSWQDVFQVEQVPTANLEAAAWRLEPGWLQNVYR